MLEEIKSTAAFIRQESNFEPELGIILGTGLGGLAQEIEVQHEFPYEQIPNFPVSTVEGHSGKLILGNLAGKRVIAMQGRFHYYEGYSMQEVVFPVRVMKVLGIKRLIVSNASGGVNPDFEIGDIMLIRDQINLFPDTPLRGRNIDELGTRFPDMSDAYDHQMLTMAQEIAAKHNIKVQTGVYAGVSGPSLETPAEYFYIRTIGADVVGMSTVPEVIASRHMEIPTFGVSIVTDLGVEGKIVEVTHEDVQAVASKAEPLMTRILKDMITQLD